MKRLKTFSKIFTLVFTIGAVLWAALASIVYILDVLARAFNTSQDVVQAIFIFFLTVTLISIVVTILSGDF